MPPRVCAGVVIWLASAPAVAMAGAACCSRILRRRVLDGLDDVDVAGAAAEVAGDRLANLVVGRIGIAFEEGDGGHHHAGRAEAALQAMLLEEALLHRMQDAALLQPLDGADLRAIGLNGEHRAGLGRDAVHEHRAGAAARRVATDVRAGQVRHLADEVHEQQSRLDLRRNWLPVDRQGDLLFHVAHWTPPANARSAAARMALRRQRAHDLALVLRWPTQIGTGLRRLRREPRRLLHVLHRHALAHQERLGLRRADRLRTDVGEADAGLCADIAVEGDLRADRRDGVVADLALELDVGRAGMLGWRGNVDRRQHLLGPERGLHRVHQEVVNADHALTARTLRHHLRAHRHHHRGMVVGGVSMRQIAANRGEVAHDRVGDDGAGLVCAGVAPPHQVGAFQRALAHHRADDQRAVAFFEGVQPGDLAQINHIGRGGQAKLHQRDQALAAREDLRIVGMRLERLPDLRQAGGGKVGKLVRYHERPPWRGMRGRGWTCDGSDGERRFARL